MIKVKFSMSVLYKGQRYPAHTVFDAADEDEAALIKDGAIVMERSKKDDKPHLVKPSAPAATEKDQVEISPDMTVSELVEIAEKYDVDMKGKTKKSEIYNILVEHFKSK